jgi:hypothetical protein
LSDKTGVHTGDIENTGSTTDQPIAQRPGAAQFSIRGLLLTLLVISAVLAGGRLLGGGASIIEAPALLGMIASACIAGLPFASLTIRLILWCGLLAASLAIGFAGAVAGLPLPLAFALAPPIVASGVPLWVLTDAPLGKRSLRWALLIGFCSVALTTADPLTTWVFALVAYSLMTAGAIWLRITDRASWRRVGLIVGAASAATLLAIASYWNVGARPLVSLTVATMIPLLWFAMHTLPSRRDA